MSGEIHWLGRIAEVYGPVATILFVLLVLLLFLYRRDHLVKSMLDKEARDHVTHVLDHNAQAMDRLAEAVTRSTEISRVTGEQYTRQIEDLVQLSTRLRTRRGRR